MYKVILIDDEPWALYALKQGADWENKGFSIAGTAGSAEDGLDLIKAIKPDVVFTDICMDEYSGIDLLRLAQEQGAVAEFVIVSAYGEFTYARDAIQYGVFDYILKPVEKADGNKLLERLRKHLEQKKAGEKETADSLSENVPESLNPNFNLLLEYLHTHYKENLTLSFLAEKFYLNTSYICVLFKKNQNDTFTGYLNQLRLKEARRLLLETNDTTTMIAETVGYRDYYYFNKIFKKEFGLTPRQCRMEGRKRNVEKNRTSYKK